MNQSQLHGNERRRDHLARAMAGIRESGNLYEVPVLRIYSRPIPRLTRAGEILNSGVEWWSVISEFQSD
jgi:hypothetical protein